MSDPRTAPDYGPIAEFVAHVDAERFDGSVDTLAAASARKAAVADSVGYAILAFVADHGRPTVGELAAALDVDHVAPYTRPLLDVNLLAASGFPNQPDTPLRATTLGRAELTEVADE